jgi:hypothetical protein
MRTMIGRSLGVLVASLGLVVLLATPAGAHPDKGPKSHPAPEIDPSGLGAIASLLVGGAVLLKSQRSARTRA